MFFDESLFSALGNKEKWKAASVKTPMPVFYRLRSITELFNGNYFKIGGVDIRSIREELLDALQVRFKCLME